MTRHMVSVIVPVYNNAPYLRRCVDSLLAQTYTNLEIIVVDDGSTDEPQTQLQGITDPRMAAVVTLPHRGVSTARNAGIMRARGEYIVFVDGDDWVEPRHIELLADGLKHADCAMVLMSIDYPHASSVNAANEAFFKACPRVERDQFARIFEQYLLSSPCNKIYRTQHVKEADFIQFDPSISYAEDLVFNLQYFTHLQSVALIPSATYHYVKHPNSGTTRFHLNTAYTLGRISKEVVRLFGSELPMATLGMLMNHYVWGITNLHHRQSTLTDRQTVAELSAILAIPEYRLARPAIKAAGISGRYQWLLKIDNATILHKAFKMIGK